jgi:hypothetical protein
MTFPLFAELKFTKSVPIEGWTYSVVLQLNDTALINGNKTVSPL